MYENCKTLGPYIRKDNRKIIIIKIEGKWKTLSYPKFLMEKHLGRFLTDSETVDHINADFTDDRIENLQILSRSENARKSHIDGTAHKGPLNLSDEQRNERSINVRGEKNPASKFTEKLVIELREKFKNREISAKDITQQYQVSEKTARSLLRGKTYGDVAGIVTAQDSKRLRMEEVKALRSAGYSIRSISEMLTMSTSTVQKYLKT